MENLVKQPEAKRKISAFEFAIMQAAHPKESDKYEPFTRAEENQMRLDKLMNQAKEMRVKH